MSSNRFLDACYGRPTDCTPIWLMRQAGRYQRSYRELREKTSFFELCCTPELAAKVTVDAVNELGVDAGIIFSDILVPVMAMGADFKITDIGPRLEEPVRTRADVDALRPIDPHRDVPFVLEAVRQARTGLASDVALIGFAGAPLTLASYLVEGSQSKNFTIFKQLLLADPTSAHKLMEKLTAVVIAHLRAQVDAGCGAVQLFDSWAGILSPRDYRHYALPYLQQIFAALEPLKVPRILFGTCAAALLPLFAQSGADVVGLDWRVSIGWAKGQLPGRLAIQGNLDPCYLLADSETIDRGILEILEEVGDKPGHIFNLGHGVLPETPEENARYLVDRVHELSQRRGAGMAEARSVASAL